MKISLKLTPFHGMTNSISKLLLRQMSFDGFSVSRKGGTWEVAVFIYQTTSNGLTSMRVTLHS